MENLDPTYQKLRSVNSLSNYSDEEALSYMEQLIDLSWDLQNSAGPRHAIKLSEELEKRKLSEDHQARFHYYLGNAWRDLRVTSRGENDLSWEWEQEELEEEIINYRKALVTDGFYKLQDERKCQILTNLGNTMSHIGRFVECIDYRNSALKIVPSFSMAIGNRGFGLSNYARSLYDEGHSALMLKYAHTDLKNALSGDLYDDAREGFNSRREWIESVLSPKYLKKGAEMYDFSLGTSEKERQYRNWCLNNRLFLNPLNDLGPYPIAAHDVLTTPGIVVSLGEGPYYQGYYNQMKQEFISARYLYYEGINSGGTHFSDKDVLLFNTLDYPSYSLAVEKIKSAFRISYSLFDKISYFLNHYLEISIPERNVYFRSFWYSSQSRKKGLRSEFVQRQNWPLRGLFWLSKDLYEDNPGFKESIEPDAKELHNIRNHLEHKYLKLHDGMWRGLTKDDDKISRALADTLAFSMYREEFEAKTLNLLKMSRASLIYLSLAIHSEEWQRSKKLDGEARVAPMSLGIIEDDWKI